MLTWIYVENKICGDGGQTAQNVIYFTVSSRRWLPDYMLIVVSTLFQHAT